MRHVHHSFACHHRHGDHDGAHGEGPAGRDLEIDGQFPAFVDDDGLHHRALGSGPDQRRIRCDPVRSKGRAIPQCLNEIGLAEPVGSDEYRSARRQFEIDAFPRPEVAERQVPDIH